MRQNWRICIELPEELPDKIVNELEAQFKREVWRRIKYYRLEQKYTLPKWIKDKEDYPLFTKTEIKELFDLGLNIRVNHGCYDCGGYFFTMSIYDPETNLEVEGFSYYPGWDDVDIGKMLKPFQEIKCDRIAIEEYW